MAIKLEWADEALDDIESIAIFIEKDSPTYAKVVVSKIFEKAEVLQDFPKLGRIVPELNNPTIREIFVYNYRVIYKLEDKKIIFIAVVHNKRELENHNNL